MLKYILINWRDTYGKLRYRIFWEENGLEYAWTIEELVDSGVTQIIPGSPLGPDRAKAIKLIGEKMVRIWRKK